jgi:hypothetical protein
MTRARRTGALVAGVALLGSVTACTTSGHPSAQVTSSPAAVTAPSTPPPTPTTAVASSSTPPASSPAPTSTPALSTPAAASSSAAPRSTCTTVTVRVIRGSASLGQEIAALQFTNEGTRTCVLVGFPTVALLRKGKQIGNSSQPSSLGTSKRTLGPGEIAESILHDYTQTCNAPLSDSLRVQVPGSATTAIRPGVVMRGCILRVDSLRPPQ